MLPQKLGLLKAGAHSKDDTKKKTDALGVERGHHVKGRLGKNTRGGDTCETGVGLLMNRSVKRDHRPS